MNVEANSIGQASLPSKWTEIVVAVAAAGIGVLLASNFWALALTILAAVVYFAVVRANALFYFIAATMPLTYLVPVNIPARDLMLLVRFAALLGVVVGRIVARKSLCRWIFGTPFNWIILAYGTWAVASVAYSHNLTEWAQRSLFRLASYLALYFAVTGWLENEEQLRTICKVLLWSTIITELFGFFQLAAGDYTSIYWFFYTADENALPWTGRITSFLNYSNSLAGYLNLMIPLGIGMVLARVGSPLRKLGIWAAILGSFAMVLTESRGGLLALAVTFLITLWCFGKSFRIKVTLTVLGGVVGPIALAILGMYSERLTGTEADLGRLMLWAGAWTMFLSSPIIGVGFGNFRENFEGAQYTTKLLDAHNLYLQLLSETGVVGFALFCGICIVLIAIAVKRFRHSQTGIHRAVLFAGVAGITTVLVHGSVDYLFEVSPQFGGAFWFMIGLLSAVVAIQKTEVTHGQHAHRI